MASQRRFFQQLIANLHKRPRTKLALQLSASAAVASMPIMYWSNSAKKERAEREHEVATRIRCVIFTSEFPSFAFFFAVLTFSVSFHYISYFHRE